MSSVDSVPLPASRAGTKRIPTKPHPQVSHEGNQLVTPVANGLNPMAQVQLSNIGGSPPKSLSPSSLKGANNNINKFPPEPTHDIKHQSSKHPIHQPR